MKTPQEEREEFIKFCKDKSFYNPLTSIHIADYWLNVIAERDKEVEKRIEEKITKDWGVKRERYIGEKLRDSGFNQGLETALSIIREKR